MPNSPIPRSLPIRPPYNPASAIEARVAALEEWRVEVDAKLADLEDRVTALENP